MSMTKQELIMLQSLPLDIKIAKSLARLREWVGYYGEDNVYISFSGGKDSTVLLHLVRSIYPNVPAVFSNTGLEYPELVKFVQREKVSVEADKTFEDIAKENECSVEKLQKLNECKDISEIEAKDGLREVYIPRRNLVMIRPEKSFRQVIQEEGYPVISKKTAMMIRTLQHPTEKNETTRKLYLSDYVIKDGKETDVQNRQFRIAKKYRYLIDAPFKISHKCCNYLKKYPMKKYERETGRKPIIGTMANESRLREVAYLQHGCNVFDEKKGSCTPLGFWTEQDILAYIKQFGLDYAEIYGDIIEVEDEEGNKIYETTGENRTGCIYCMFGIQMEGTPNRFQRLEKTHPQLYKYCMESLGFKEVCEFMSIPYKNEEEKGEEKIDNPNNNEGE